MTATTETDDRLLGGRVIVRQPRDGFRVSVDTVLLAAAVALVPGARALDVGCGSGGATLCLAARVSDVALVGLDRDADMVACLDVNIIANGFADRVTAETHDVAAAVPDHLRGGFEHVFSNPPYLPAGRADTRRLDAARRAATVESVPVADWITFMARCCCPDGQMTLIHRADRLEELLPALAVHAGAIRVLPVWPREGAPAKRVIVTARIGARAPTRICPGLVLHDETGSYTAAALRLIHEGAALEF